MSQVKTGVVIIGRNEGDRLLECIRSVLDQKVPLVYVDSGSTDDSVDAAQGLGCDVIELDMNRPFTAGRGRNVGFAFLIKQYPELDYVQFIDGDCIIDKDWLSTAQARMESDDNIAIVCGRRRERYPEVSIYNLLADMEWNTPIGEATFCGGDAFIRVKAFQAVDGFDNSFAAGEEPELCYRLRQPGWTIWRLDAEMVLHDADMTKFSQWWQRSLRSGSAYAQSAWVHFNDPERYCVRDSFSIWLWAFIVPAIALILAPFTFGASLLLFGLYPVLGYRIFRYRRGHGDDVRSARIYAFFCVLGKWPQLLGQIKFLRHRESKLIEYKGPDLNPKPAQSTLEPAILRPSTPLSTLTPQSEFNQIPDDIEIVTVHYQDRNIVSGNEFIKERRELSLAYSEVKELSV